MKTIAICCVGVGLAAGLPFAAADPSTPQLHPVEKACITYEYSGQMQSGTSTRCHRDYAYEAYEINQTTIGMAGFSQSQNTHTITIGETIYSIDLDTNTGTQTVNPMYEGLVNAMANSSAEDMTDAFLNAMGMMPTGEIKTIAGTQCNVYSAQMMGTTCLTDNGLMLEQVFMGNIQRAVSVAIGDGGDDANYTLYQTVPISQGPDLSNGIGGIDLGDLMSQIPQ